MSTKADIAVWRELPPRDRAKTRGPHLLWSDQWLMGDCCHEDELRVTEDGTITETQEVDVLWPKPALVMNARIPVKP